VREEREIERRAKGGLDGEVGRGIYPSKKEILTITAPRTLRQIC